jgi:glycosyltransferase involved in cell wall biosynthesis
MKLSVIIPSFNQCDYVEAAIESILAQRSASTELIFVDGGSTDATMEKVSKYRDSFTHCISEPDHGQSDALAKGFSLATGDYLTWLNTDDLLLPGALSDFADAYASNPKCEWFLGNVVWIDARDRILRARRGESFCALGPRLGLLTAAGPSAFFSRSLYERVGGINKSLHYQMDTELWWRFILAGEPFGRLSRYSWALRLHPAAKVSGNMFRNKYDPQAVSVANLRAEEAEHLASLAAPVHLNIGRLGRKLSASALRGCSASYLRSSIESFFWRGRLVKDIFK